MTLTTETTAADIEPATFSAEALSDGPSTRAVHAGRRRAQPGHAITTPLVQSSTFTFANTADLMAYRQAKAWGDTGGRNEYGRYGNPTVRAAEVRLAALEGADDALLYPSGMAAITSVMLSMLPTGSHVVMTDDCYRRTRDFARTFLQRLGIETTTVPTGDLDTLEAAIRPETRLIVSETPTNPFQRMLDLPRVVEIARANCAKTLIDTTFATPVNLRPLDYGVDLVAHSATKYLAGHNDVLAGVVAGPQPIIDALREGQGVLGGVLDPHAAWLLERGLKTLGLRVARHNANGLALARFLEGHPRVRRVWYPGLESHPDHARRTDERLWRRGHFRVRGPPGGRQPFCGCADHPDHRAQPGRHREPGRAGGFDGLLRGCTRRAGGRWHHRHADPLLGWCRRHRRSAGRPGPGA
jgi:cystathionine gamma-synthase